MKKAKPTKAQAPDMDKLVAGEDIPRFVVSITDTQTVTGGQYFAISAGADHLEDFFRLIPKAKRTNSCRTELQAMFKYFEEKVTELDTNPWEPVKEVVEVVEDEDSK